MKINLNKKIVFAAVMILSVFSIHISAQSVTKINFNKDNVNLLVGKSESLSVTVLPDNAANKTLKWKSSNNRVVRIEDSNNTGAQIRAVDDGKATITVTAQDGSNVSASITISVMRLIEEIRLDLPIDKLALGATANLLVTISPDYVTNPELKWSSSNPDIISTTNQGRITAHKPGVATITASAQDGSGVSQQLTIEVIRPVEKVTIEGGNITLNPNQGRQLRATILPADAPKNRISWISTKTSVATIDRNGYLRTKNVGTTTIKAIADDADAGYPEGTIEVTVEPYDAAPPPPANKPVESVTINEGNQNLTVNEEKQLTAVIRPDNATNSKVIWSSDKHHVATVSSAGLVKAVGAGKAIIKVTTEDGGKTAQITVEVVAGNIAVTDVTLNKSDVNLAIGGKERLLATIAPAHATNQNVTWSSSNNAVATVDNNGEVTAHKSGEATITVTTQDGGKTAQATVNIAAENVPVATVSLNKSEVNLAIGGKERLTPIVTPVHATNQNVTWSSSNNLVATVDNDGEITAHKSGEVTITVTTQDGGKTARAIVKVATVTTAVTEVSLNKEKINLTVDGKERLYATLYPAHATNQNISWSSSDDEVASVSSNGEITAHQVGEAYITVTTEDGKKTAQAHVKVLAVAVPVESIVLSKNTINLQTGKKERLLATITPVNATSQNISWSSSNNEVASVSSNGEVTAHKSGEATITAMTKDGKKTASCKVLVESDVSNNVIDDAIAVWSDYGRLYVKSPVGEKVEVYGLTGALMHRFVKSAGEVTITLSLSRGIVIVRGSSGWVRKVKL